MRLYRNQNILTAEREETFSQRISASFAVEMFLPRSAQRDAETFISWRSSAFRRVFCGYMVFLLFATVARAERLAPAPEFQTVNEGEIVEVEIRFSHNHQIHGLSFALEFDQTKLKLKEFQPSGWLDLILHENMDNENGRFEFAGGALVNQGVTGSGVVGVLEFETVGLGIAEIAFPTPENTLGTEAYLAGDQVALEIADASVQVFGPPQRIVVEPQVMVLEPGDKQQFSAKLLDRIGQQLAAQFTWNTDGGSVDTNGLFTAQPAVSVGVIGPWWRVLTPADFGGPATGLSFDVSSGTELVVSGTGAIADESGDLKFFVLDRLLSQEHPIEIEGEIAHGTQGSAAVALFFGELPFALFGVRDGSPATFVVNLGPVQEVGQAGLEHLQPQASQTYKIVMTLTKMAFFLNDLQTPVKVVDLGNVVLDALPAGESFDMIKAGFSVFAGLNERIESRLRRFTFKNGPQFLEDLFDGHRHVFARAEGLEGQAKATIVEKNLPTAPSNLTATERHTAPIVDLSWNASTDDIGISSYRIYRRLDGVGSGLGEPIAQVSYRQTTYADQTANRQGFTYRYVVTAVDASRNEGPPSNAALVTLQNRDDEPPAQITDLQANIRASEGVELSWSESSDNVGISHYILLRNLSGINEQNRNQVDVIAAKQFDTTFLDPDPPPAQEVTYAVVAVDFWGNESVVSNNASVLAPDFEPPSPITDLRATPGLGRTEIDLTFSPSSDNVAVSHYHLYRDVEPIQTFNGFSLILQDDFDSEIYHQSMWQNLRVTEGALTKELLGGKLRLSGSGVAALLSKAELDPNQDFEVEATLSILTGEGGVAAAVIGEQTLSGIGLGLLRRENQHNVLIFRDERQVEVLDEANVPDRIKVRIEHKFGQMKLFVDKGQGFELKKTLTPAFLAEPHRVAVLAGGPGLQAFVHNIRTNGHGRPVPFARLDHPQTQFTDATGNVGRRYFYAVEAVDTSGNRSRLSGVADAVVPEPDTIPPTPPENLTATALLSPRIELTWEPSQDNTGVDRYRIFRSAGEGTPGNGEEVLLEDFFDGENLDPFVWQAFPISDPGLSVALAEGSLVFSGTPVQPSGEPLLVTSGATMTLEEGLALETKLDLSRSEGALLAGVIAFSEGGEPTGVAAGLRKTGAQISAVGFRAGQEPALLAPLTSDVVRLRLVYEAPFFKVLIAQDGAFEQVGLVEFLPPSGQTFQAATFASFPEGTNPLDARVDQVRVTRPKAGAIVFRDDFESGAVDPSRWNTQAADPGLTVGVTGGRAGGLRFTADHGRPPFPNQQPPVYPDRANTGRV